MVIVLDDIHWADDASLDLAASLVAEPGEARILVVCGARPAFYDRRPSWQAGERRHRRIDLLPLSARDSRRLVGDILRLVPDLPDDLRDTVAGTAEGNPFHVEELVKMLIEDGVMVKGTDAWSVAHDRLAAVRVPETLVGVLQARIDVLGPEEKSVLHRAAVIGRSFWDRAVAALGDGDDVAGPLTELRTRELVYAKGDVEHRRRRRVHLQARRAPRGRLRVGPAPAPSGLPRQGSRLAERRRRGHRPRRRVRRPRRRSPRRRRTGRRGRHLVPTGGKVGRRTLCKHRGPGAVGQGRRADAGDDLELRYKVAGARQEIHGILGDRAVETEDLDALAGIADRLADDRKRIDVA